MRYTSDLTDSQWEIVKPLLGKKRNRKYDKRELVNAVLYIVKKGVWEAILQCLVEKTRQNAGRNCSPSYGIVDYQKRWAVERIFSWLGHSRRLSKDYEIKTSCAETMVMISHLHTLLRRC